MKKIYFAPKMDGYNPSYEHPLFEDEVYIPPISFLEYYKKEHEKHTYWQCPAWKKSLKNSYVFFSQIDIEVTYNKETGVISDESFKYFSFDEGTGLVNESFFYSQPAEEPPKPPYNGIAVGQINQHIVFWPENNKYKNFWLEILPIPNMISTHGLELIGGEYPFSRWFRPALFAFKFHKEKTIIKRGQPLGIIKFRNIENYSEDFKLEKSMITNEIMRKSENHTRLKIFLPNKSWNLIKNDKKSKCPFWKLWRKSRAE